MLSPSDIVIRPTSLTDGWRPKSGRAAAASRADTDLHGRALRSRGAEGARRAPARPVIEPPVMPGIMPQRRVPRRPAVGTPARVVLVSLVPPRSSCCCCGRGRSSCRAEPAHAKIARAGQRFSR